MATKKTDIFANIAAIYISESAANTQTSIKFNFPFSIMDKMAIVVSRIEYLVTGLNTALAASADFITTALTCASAVTNINDQSDPLIVDSVRYGRFDFGAAASGLLVRQPYIKDFTNLQGGGLLLAPTPLYAMIQGTSCGAAAQAWLRLFYTYMELNSDEYWQLVESRRIISD